MTTTGPGWGRSRPRPTQPPPLSRTEWLVLAVCLTVIAVALTWAIGNT